MQSFFISDYFRLQVYQVIDLKVLHTRSVTVIQGDGLFKLIGTEV